MSESQTSKIEGDNNQTMSTQVVGKVNSLTDQLNSAKT